MYFDILTYTFKTNFTLGGDMKSIKVKENLREADQQERDIEPKKAALKERRKRRHKKDLNTEEILDCLFSIETR
jgi:hypothetical protein